MVSISTFTGFLVGGLVIITVFSIFGGLFHEEAQREKTTLTKSFPLEFSVSKLRESMEVKLPNAVLFNGLLFGSSDLKYNLTLPNDTEQAELSFDVARTNLYGSLTIKAAGFTESRRLPKGHYSFDIGKKDGFVTIQPDSSWWRIWAPALYGINNTKITIKAYKSQTDSYSFSLDNLGVDSASLVLQFDKNTGSFDVELNSMPVYSGAAKGVHTIQINTSMLATENRLFFSTANNSQFSGTGTLVINYRE